MERYSGISYLDSAERKSLEEEIRRFVDENVGIYPGDADSPGTGDFTVSSDGKNIWVGWHKDIAKENKGKGLIEEWKGMAKELIEILARNGRIYTVYNVAPTYFSLKEV